MSPLMNARLLALGVVLSTLVGWTAAVQSAPTDPLTVVKSLYAALNAKQADKAITYVADNALFSWPGIGVYSGKGKIQEFFRDLVRRGWTFKGSNYRVNGGRVTYAYEIYEQGNLLFSASDGVTIVKNGKVIFDGTEATAPR